MKNAVLALFGVLSLVAQGQNQELEKLRLIENSVHIEEPKGILPHTRQLKPLDSLVLITFSKTTGELLEHKMITKGTLIRDLDLNQFQYYYFVVLIDRTAIFYMD
ncbi:hypothetical protein [Flagellimonas allohymeniacidonis]|uniref:Uncharacterized protein n=1 Tax=Flagellimonas allohymeniacidonis TaxID=2517819 RepID=A0A4Q8QG82_9FLAO|nr:hypothetical protein [Allomuricauda hymeniacidonis]TAI49481.1 hypothetical protein EW142_06685 [Allomuricauda hymeniacidonis]